LVQTASRISSFERTRPGFSTRNCSNRNDLGSRDRVSPLSVTLRFERLISTPLNRYRRCLEPIITSSSAFRVSSDGHQDPNSRCGANCPHGTQKPFENLPD